MNGESDSCPDIILNGKTSSSNSELSQPSSSRAEHNSVNGIIRESSDEVSEDLLITDIEEPPVSQIQHDLDELTYSGATINDLEVQLIRTKDIYQQKLVDGRQRVDMLRKKLRSSIIKSEPFIGVWRKAKQVQELSNKAAARYDKANSQHAASKEMIRVAETQLAACRAEQLVSDEPDEPSSPSPLDLAWQEMLNHATSKVVVTEKERRDSEMEHRRILEECNRVMEAYRATERKLHSHIVKSRPYYEEKYRVNRDLAILRKKIKDFEQKISESKRSYSASLKRLEMLNTEMHQRRGTFSSEVGKYALDPRVISSTGSSPNMRRTMKGGIVSVSMDSLQMSEVGEQFTGSTGSLPSIGSTSNSEHSVSPDPDSKSPRHEASPRTPPLPPLSTSDNSTLSSSTHKQTMSQEEIIANDLVVKCLDAAVNRFKLEGRQVL